MQYCKAIIVQLKIILKSYVCFATSNSHDEESFIRASGSFVNEKAQLITWTFSVSRLRPLLSHDSYVRGCISQGPHWGRMRCRVFSEEVLRQAWAECIKSQGCRGADGLGPRGESEEVPDSRGEKVQVSSLERSCALWLRDMPAGGSAQDTGVDGHPSFSSLLPSDCLSDSLGLHPARNRRHLWSTQTTRPRRGGRWEMDQRGPTQQRQQRGP